METKPILWESSSGERHFPCFTKGCQEEAEHVTRFIHGEAVVQVCLCDQCMKKSPEQIIWGLSFLPKNTVH